MSELDEVTFAYGGFPSLATTALGDWYGTTMTVTSTTTVANTQSTSTTNNAPQLVFTTRVNHQSNDFIKCTFTDGYTYEVPRAAAIQIVQMQALMQEYRKETSELKHPVNFRDTSSMQYSPKTSSEVNEQSAALNANRQREAVLNANGQREAARNANTQR